MQEYAATKFFLVLLEKRIKDREGGLIMKRVMFLCFLLVVTLVAAVATFPGQAKSQDTVFSFVGIKWTDKPNQVIEKLNNNELKGRWSKGDWGGVEIADWNCLASIISPQVDRKKYDYLNSVGLRIHTRLKGILLEGKEVKTTTDQTGLTLFLINQEEEGVKSFVFKGTESSLVRAGSFNFAYSTEKLLSYNLFLSQPAAENSQDEGDTEFYRGLVKKYGKPTKVNASSVKWVRGNESLYYFYNTFARVDIYLFYFSEKNIEDCVSSIRKAKQSLRSKDSERVKKDVQDKF